jgi:transglutaminase-like putative cysteine protease
MQLHIRRQIAYRYERPVKHTVQSLHLKPQRDINQRLLSWRIATAESAAGRDYHVAALVRGVRQGGGGESMLATVFVAASAQQQ